MTDVLHGTPKSQGITELCKAPSHQPWFVHLADDMNLKHTGMAAVIKVRQQKPVIGFGTSESEHLKDNKLRECGKTAVSTYLCLILITSSAIAETVSSQYDKISDYGRSTKPNRNPAYDLRKFLFSNFTLRPLTC